MYLEAFVHEVNVTGSWTKLLDELDFPSSWDERHRAGVGKLTSPHKPLPECVGVSPLRTRESPLCDWVLRKRKMLIVVRCGVEVSTDHHLAVSWIRWQGTQLDRPGKPKHAVRVTSKCLAGAPDRNVFSFHLLDLLPADIDVLIVVLSPDIFIAEDKRRVI